MPIGAIERFLAENCGLEGEAVGRENIRRAVFSFMNRLEIKDSRQCLELLKESPAELEKLRAELVVPETWFFRDHGPFAFLRDIMQNDGLGRNKEGRLRVLSVPCSTGEEPYSIAMGLLEAGLSPGQFTIDAGDISFEAIEIARKGFYGGNSFREEGPGYQQRYFTATGRGAQLDPHLVSLVHFHHGDFLQPDFQPSPGAYQVVFCKNLIIYLNAQARGKVLYNLGRLLAADGLLFAGHSELMFFLQNGYAAVPYPKAFVCRKADGAGLQAALARSAKMGVKKIPETAKPPVPGPPAAQSGLRRPGEKTAGEGREEILARVRTLADGGALREADALCRQILGQKEMQAEAYYWLGLINAAADRPDPAEDFFLKALYLNPSYNEVLVHLSLLYEKRGETGKAAVYKERVERLQGNGKKNGERKAN